MSLVTEGTTFSLLTAVKTLQHKADPDGLYVQDILATFGSRSHAFLVLFFSIPFVQPVPLAGLSTIVGSVIMLLGLFLALGRAPWLPEKILRRHIQSHIIQSVCRGIIRVLEKTEKIIRPRLGGLVLARGVEILNGSLILLFAFLLALPLPIPFTNSVPAYFLILNALAWLEGDGVLLLISYAVAIAGIIFFLGLGVGAAEILDYLYLKLQLLL
ncbi:MAG: exopolysaccharide biosynthesis protein [Bdellovibrionales bacterium]